MDSHQVFFNEKASNWDEDENPAKIDHLSRIFKDYVSPIHGNILDVGCGTGIIVPVLRQVSTPQSKILELDFSIEMLRCNQLRWQKAEIGAQQVNADAHQLPFPDGLFHFIACFAVIPHLSNQQKALQEFFRVTTESGRLLILHLMSSWCLNRFHAEAGRAICQDRLPVVSQMLEMVQSAGFTPLHWREQDDLYLILAEKKELNA